MTGAREALVFLSTLHADTLFLHATVGDLERSRFIACLMLQQVKNADTCNSNREFWLRYVGDVLGDGYIVCLLGCQVRIFRL